MKSVNNFSYQNKKPHQSPEEFSDDNLNKSRID